MCDYSLEFYRSRPARADERYETHRFPSHTVGVVAPSDRETAICLSCDTRLRLSGLSGKVQVDCGVDAEAEATFVRLETGPHHDGVRFDDGREISLQLLGPGVGVEIVPARAMSEAIPVRPTARPAEAAL